MKVIQVFILILIINILLIVGYNLNTKDPFILKYGNSSYFGYSIILHKSAMIIGAPKDNYSISSKSHVFPHEPGAAWKYIFNTREWKQFRPGVNDETGFSMSTNMSTLVMKKNGWFGASLALQEDSDVLTICAPRTSISLIAPIVSVKLDTMHGMCYTGKISTGYFEIEDPNLSSYDFSVPIWFHPIRGFSVHYPSSSTHQSKNNKRMIMGCPKHKYLGSVRIEGQSASVSSSEPDMMTQFGYAVSSGRFFDKNQLLYVGGGPGWNFTGQVAIFDPSTDPATVIYQLNGTTPWEYFGASLAVGDMNNDGLDDLIVGAPHWGNDNGRVYIYFGNKNGFSKANIILDGYLDDGLFGYAVTCGDLDADEFDDLIVGAPYEDDGAIYVYNGDFNISQEIEKNFQKINVHSRIKTFGFSLAKPVDIDANGFPDLGIGAYKSGHAILLKSRPVVKTNLRLSTIPVSLYQNSTNFLVKICVQHIEKGFPKLNSINLTLNVDEHFKRVNKSQSMLEFIPNEDMSTIEEVCLNTTFYILHNIKKNYFDPINIVVTHRFGQMKMQPNKKIEACQLCPIEVKGAPSKTLQLALPFDLNCGPDEICSAEIKMHANFDGNKSAWIIGSQDITYEVYIINHGEPAYSTEIIVELPQGISLRSFSPSCKKHGDITGILKIKCEVDDPLYLNDTKKKIEFVLDMSQLNDGSLNGTFLNINVMARTRSENSGTHNISTSLLLLSHIVTVIEGNANDRNYFYTLDDETLSDIYFQHSYEVLKSGATSIDKAKLNVDVPVKFGDLELIFLTHTPNIRVSGKMYECSVINIPILGEEENIALSNLKRFDDEQSRKVRDINELPQKVSSFHESEFDNTTDDRVVNLDCSSPNVSCGKIICDINSLKSKRDNVVLQLQFSMNPKLLTDEKNYVNKCIIAFTTQTWIDIIKPFPGTKKITKVTTLFRQVEKLRKISIWIIVGSIFLGLLALFFIAIILRMLGFFRRDKKDAMETLKTKNEVRNLPQKDTEL